VPDSITAEQLDPEAMAELRTLPGDLADAVARFLVATGLEEEPERAYQYAVAARGLAARVGIVRETCAIAAYQAGNWTDALTEFRAARRLTGRNSYLPLMADCERALGRLDRALDTVTGPEAQSADRATQIELRIVESGIRRDQSLPEAAVVALQLPELTEKRGRKGHARLFYAYADALLDAGRDEEAREWFGKAAAADSGDETDAAERVEELDEVLIEDLDDAWDDPDEPDDDEPDGDEADDEDGLAADAVADDAGDINAEPEDAVAGETVADNAGGVDAESGDAAPDDAGNINAEPGKADAAADDAGELGTANGGSRDRGRDPGEPGFTGDANAPGS
jgi:tetratricopeptide (TPR) repeat protein